MNTHLSLSAMSAVALSAFLSFGAVATAGTVVTDFTGTYPSGGSGWAGDWAYRHFRTTAPDSKAEYRNTHAVGDNANYMSVRYNRNIGTSNPGAYSILSRPFDTSVVDNFKTHTVTFEFRLDYATHWNVDNERISVFAASQELGRNAAYDATTTNTWGISYDGANGWSVIASDGQGGIRFVTPSSEFISPADGNTVYSVTINVNPTAHTFSVSISDGSRTENWGNDSFTFINPVATAGGEYLHFYAHSRNGVALEYSLANLRVEQIPEPTTALLMGATLLGFGLWGWRGKQAKR